MEVPKFPAQPAYKWASYIPDRKPKFKVHANRGLAYNGNPFSSTSRTCVAWSAAKNSRKATRPKPSIMFPGR